MTIGLSLGSARCKHGFYLASPALFCKLDCVNLSAFSDHPFHNSRLIVPGLPTHNRCFSGPRVFRHCGPRPLTPTSHVDAAACGDRAEEGHQALPSAVLPLQCQRGKKWSAPLLLLAHSTSVEVQEMNFFFFHELNTPQAPKTIYMPKDCLKYSLSPLRCLPFSVGYIPDT